MVQYCLHDGQKLRHLKGPFSKLYLCEKCETVWRNTATYKEKLGQREWNLQEVEG